MSEPAAGSDRSTWREAAVARSIDPARARAEKRLQRFLDAACELMAEAHGGEFTVQEVVERSGQSLRSFYQYFGGKHELLLAMFEESVRSSAERLRVLVDEEADALGRLRRFTVEYHQLCRPDLGGLAAAGRPRELAPAVPPIPALAGFAQQLLTEHPREAATAYVPLVALFEELLDAAAAAGAIRPGLQHRFVAGVVLQAIMFNSFAWTIGGRARLGGDPAQGLWDLVLHGVG